MATRIQNHRKYPLRNLDIDIKWVIDSSICGCVYGEKKEYTIWVSLSNDVLDIKNTIAHELAHIHAYQYFRKTKGDKVFYSHSQLHKDLEKYYETKWVAEVEKLYDSLEHAEIDITVCDVLELQKVIHRYAKNRKPKFDKPKVEMEVA
jgi:hypothetical protein